MPEISIIVPVFNAKAYIEKCITSILSQTFHNFELIIVDDGSNDGTSEICDSFSDKRIRVIHQTNHGVSAARNYGLQHAKGAYILFVDADDTIRDNMLNLMYTSARKTDSDIVLCGLKTTHPDNTVFENIAYNESWAPWGKLIKRSTIKHEFNQKIFIGEDLLFCYQNSDNWKKASYIPGVLYNYSQDSTSTMRNHQFSYKDITCLDAILEVINDKKISLKLKAFFQAYYIKTYYYIFAKNSKNPKFRKWKEIYSEPIHNFYKNAKSYGMITKKYSFNIT